MTEESTMTEEKSLDGIGVGYPGSISGAAQALFYSVIDILKASKLTFFNRAVRCVSVKISDLLNLPPSSQLQWLEIRFYT